MTTKKEMIDLIKLENPTLRVGDDDAGYSELSDKDYQNIIEQWADARLAKQAEAEAKASAKSALLEKLGITEDEAKLLLA